MRLVTNKFSVENQGLCPEVHRSLQPCQENVIVLLHDGFIHRNRLPNFLHAFPGSIVLPPEVTPGCLLIRRVEGKGVSFASG